MENPAVKIISLSQQLEFLSSAIDHNVLSNEESCEGLALLLMSISGQIHQAAKAI